MPRTPNTRNAALSPMTIEHRIHPRQPAVRPQPIRLLSARGAQIGTAVPQDVSASGVRLAASCPAQAATLVTLAPDQQHPLAGQHLSFRVTRCEPAPAGGYLLV